MSTSLSSLITTVSEIQQATSEIQSLIYIQCSELEVYNSGFSRIAGNTESHKDNILYTTTET
jgi:hypothetical protein